ncbi:MAG: hypothetical protein V7K78_07305 [Nostoc sp.]
MTLPFQFFVVNFVWVVDVSVGNFVNSKFTIKPIATFWVYVIEPTATVMAKR